MTKALGLFVFKYVEPKLPKELISIIINDLPSNKLFYLLHKYPNKNWNWHSLSHHPEITPNIIEKYADKPWDWYNLSSKFKFANELVWKYPNKNWDWSAITLTITDLEEFITKHPNKPWNWNALPVEYFSLSFIEKFIDKPFYWARVSENINLTLDLIRKYPNKQWNSYGYSAYVDIEDINDELLSWEGISLRDDLTIEFLKKYEDKIYWGELAWSVHLRPDIIDAFPDKNWDWNMISSNEKIDTNFVLRHKDKPWDILKLIENPNVHSNVFELL